jgi:hypothetical protein
MRSWMPLRSEQREERRTYLGASGIGSECLRKVQFDWQRDSVHAARTKRIFSRGHMFEEVSVKALGQAGFRMERGTPATAFSACNDDLSRGHADGIIVAGPEVPGMTYPALWEHKALGASGWKKIEKYGLKTAYPVYYDQCQLYMAYLGLTPIRRYSRRSMPTHATCCICWFRSIQRQRRPPATAPF